MRRIVKDPTGEHSSILLKKDEVMDARDPRRSRLRGTLLIDLRKDLDSIWKGMKNRRRKEIRRAQRRGVEITFNPPRKQRLEWLELFRALRLRMGTPMNENHENHVRKLLGLDGRGGLLVTASHNDHVLCGELFHITEARSGSGAGKGLSLIYAATDEDPGTKSLAGLAHALLIWRAIQWAKQRDLVEYDFGGWNCFRKEVEGISKWKESFGGTICWYLTNEAPLKDQTAAERRATVKLEDIIVWFDDGHVSIYEHGLPFFKSLGLKAIVALVTGSVGGLLEASRRTNYRIMDIPQLSALIDEGWEIASHTVTHSYLPWLTLDQARQEFEESKQWIIDNLGVIPTKFAAPYNEITPEQLDVALEYYDYVRPIIPPRPPQPGGIHAMVHALSRHGSYWLLRTAIPSDPGFLNFLTANTATAWGQDREIVAREISVEKSLKLKGPNAVNYATYSSPMAVEAYVELHDYFLDDDEASIFKDYLRSPRRAVIDLGSGTGRITRLLKNAGHDVIGVDNSPVMIQRARKEHPDIDFRIGDAASLKFPDCSFDSAVFNGIDLIYPEERRLQCLREVHRILKPGGTFVFSSHNRQWLDEQDRPGTMPYDPPYYRHDGPYGTTILYFTTASDQQAQLEQTGYKLLETYGSPNSPWIYYVGKRISVEPNAVNYATYSGPIAIEVYAKMTDFLDEDEASIFNDHLRSPHRAVIDLGSGTGRITRLLKNAGHDVIGVDISPTMVQRARKEHPDIDFRIGDATSLKFPDCSFDSAVFAFNGLGLIYPEERRLQCLREVHRILKPGGTFVFSSHNRQWLDEQDRPGTTPYDPPYYRHDGPYGTTILYFITPSDQQAQLEQTGYQLLETYGVFRPWVYYLGKRL